MTYATLYSPVGNAADGTPADDYATVKLFSGNRIAVLGSGQVSSFYNNFSNPSINTNWVVDSGSYSLINGYLQTQSSPTIIHSRNYVDQNNTVVVSKIAKWTGSTGFEIKTLRGFSDTTHWTQLDTEWGPPNNFYAVHNKNGAVVTTPINDVAHTFTDSQWAISQFGWSGSSVLAKINNDSWSTGTLAFSAGKYIGLRNYGTDLRIDYIYVKKYSAIEPQTTVGSEVIGDTTDPVISSVNLTNGQVVYGVFSIKVSATDAESGVDYIEFYIDDALKHTATSSPYYYDWDTLQYHSPHTVRIIAYDEYGNNSEVNYNVNVINELPYTGQ